MGLSVHAASTIGSLTHRHFYGWKRCNRSIRGKMTEEENLRRNHERRQAIRIERRAIGKDSRDRKKKGNGQKKRENNYRF